VFVAPFGIKGGQTLEQGNSGSTEDDLAGSLQGYPLTLKAHSADVEEKAEEFARKAGLPPERIVDLKLSGYLHDAGKIDPRFQAWLHYGDPLGPDPEDLQQILAKSGRALPPLARKISGLPAEWRHEALSVRLALRAHRFTEANDPELVLWLIGAHHGYGRPLFPHDDPDDSKVRELPALLGLPDELEPGSGPQSFAFDWNGLDWPNIYSRLKSRYGFWELARMEAILRLADHRASEEASVDRSIAAGEEK
jgi:CRISPR-associated endonuclease/helicase Cas3